MQSNQINQYLTVNNLLIMFEFIFIGGTMLVLCGLTAMFLFYYYQKNNHNE